MNESKKSLIRKVYPLTTKKKKMIFTKIKDIKNNIFNECYLKTILPTISNLNDIDLTKLLNINNEEFKQCVFLEKQFCWISSNEEGKQRYFTKGHLTYSLDIYDLLTIYFNCSYNQLFGFVMELGFNDNSWKKQETVKYVKNLKEIDDIITENSSIANLIKDKIDIYMALNNFGINNSLSFDKYKSNSIFFISTRYLKEKYKLSYSISTINQTINLYALLGLLYKVPEKEMNNPIYYAYSKVKTKRASISFYSMPSIENLITDISLKSDILSVNKVGYYGVNKSISTQLLQTYNVLDINYNYNSGGGDKTKKAKKFTTEKEKIENLFEKYLLNSEIVAKEWIKNELGSTISDTVFDRKWKEIIGEKKGRSVKPTKRMKLKYQLETNQDVFIRREN